MNVGGVWVVIVVFTILYIIALLQTLSGLLSREPRKKKLHVANVPLHFVHGLVSILLYIDLRRNADHVACPPGSRGLVAGAGIRGCVVGTGTGPFANLGLSLTSRASFRV